MNQRHLLPFLFASFLLPSLADTIVLRDGKQLEGEIISETEDAYLAKIYVTKTIRDERRIPKNTVLRVIKVEKDALEFEVLQKLVPTPDLLSVDDYEARIKQVSDFIQKYPNTKHKAEADKLVAELEKEATVVRGGGLKWQGKMISPEEHASQAYPLDAAVIGAEFDALVKKNNRVQALRAWDKLSEDFKNSRARAQRVPAALAMMKSFKAAIDRQVETCEARLEKRQSDLESLSGTDRQRTEAMFKESAAAYEARVAKEREDRQRWISLDPWHKAEMEDFSRNLEQEINMLSTGDSSESKDGDAAWAKAWKALEGEGTLDEKRQAIYDAQSELPQTYVEKLTAKLAEQEAAAAGAEQQ